MERIETMKTQQAGQENTLLEVNVIPEEMDVLPTSTAKLPKNNFQGMVSLLRMMGLVILGLVLGFILTMVIYKSAGKQVREPLKASDLLIYTCCLQLEALTHFILILYY